MSYAITPMGIGESVGARSIREGWNLTESEKFTVDYWNGDMVLSDDESSLRYRTDEENLNTYKENKITELKISFDTEIKSVGLISSALGSDHKYDAELHNIQWVLACVSLTSVLLEETPLITCDDLLGNADSKIQRRHNDGECGQLLKDVMAVIQGMKDKLAGLRLSVYAVASGGDDPESEIDLIVWDEQGDDEQ